MEEITRKEAIKKMGKYAGLTALGTFLILSPLACQAQSAGDNRNDNGWGNNGNNGNGNNGNNGNGNGGF